MWLGFSVFCIAHCITLEVRVTWFAHDSLFFMPYNYLLKNLGPRDSLKLTGNVILETCFEVAKTHGTLLTSQKLIKRFYFDLMLIE